jgi:hypothetical protein
MQQLHPCTELGVWFGCPLSDLPWRRGGGTVLDLLAISFEALLLALSPSTRWPRPFFFPLGRPWRRGREDGAGVAADVCWWRRGSMESTPSAAAPKRRRRCAAAIFGHRSGPASLGLHGQSLFFLLQWRIFLDLGVAENAAAPPSGLAPGGCRGGALRGQRPSAVKLDLIAFGDLSYGDVCQK